MSEHAVHSESSTAANRQTAVPDLPRTAVMLLKATAGACALPHRVCTHGQGQQTDLLGGQLTFVGGRTLAIDGMVVTGQNNCLVLCVPVLCPGKVVLEFYV